MFGHWVNLITKYLLNRMYIHNLLVNEARDHMNHTYIHNTRCIYITKSYVYT